MDVEQPDLFASTLDEEELALSRDRVATLAGEMTKGLSRDRIADEMTARGCTTSTAMINAWASPARSSHNLPLYAAPVFEAACNSTLLSDWHVGIHQGIAFYGEDALVHEIAAELAELEAHRRDLNRMIREVRKVRDQQGRKA